MRTTRELFTATLLDTGEVLVAGSQNSNFFFPFISGAELYNPATGTFTPTGSLNNGRRYFHTATCRTMGRS